MSREHEYSLLGGVNRSKVGRYLYAASAVISGGVILVVLGFVDLANRVGVPVNLPPAIMSLLGAAGVYLALYWFFDRIAWKWPPVAALLKLPDLSGESACDGVTLGPGELRQNWEAMITIVQSWDRIRVHLRSNESASDSITAALLSDAAEGYRLFYSYRNQPRIGEAELAGHTGSATLVFSKDCRHAEGEYFNGVGRQTFGTMRLIRR